MSHQPTTNTDVEHDSSLQADSSTKMAISTLSSMNLEPKDLYIKIRTRSLVTLLMFLYEFL